MIRLSFAEGVLRDRDELDAKITELLEENARRLGVDLSLSTLSGRFRSLITTTQARFGERVVVLVDEYDKPILDNLAEPERARELRDGLRNL